MSTRNQKKALSTIIVVLVLSVPASVVSETNTADRLQHLAFASLAPADTTDSNTAPSTLEGRVEAGLNATSGNSETFTSRLAFQSLYKSSQYRTRVESAYYYGTIEEEDAVNNFMALAINDWLFLDSPWSAFVKGRYDYDEFNFWKHRVSLHGGAGYRVADEESLLWLLRAGAGLTKEYETEDDELKPEALFGYDLLWKITEGQELKMEQTIYPDLGDLGEYRLSSSGSWTAKIAGETSISLGAGFTHEYQSEVDEGYDHYDLKYYAMMTADF